jgi:hypothetical protein
VTRRGPVDPLAGRADCCWSSPDRSPRSGRRGGFHL